MQRLNAWLEAHITLHNYDDPKAEKENAITHVIGAVLALIALLSILFKLPLISSRSLQVGIVPPPSIIFFLTEMGNGFAGYWTIAISIF